MSLWPLIWPRARGASAIIAAACLVGALGVAIGLHVSSPWSPRYPQVAEPLYVADEGAARAWRVSPFAPDRWTAAVLAADGGKASRVTFPTFRRPAWAAPAGAIPLPAPAIEITKAADGTVIVHAGMAPGATLHLDLKTDAVIIAGAVDGKAAPILDQPGKWSHLVWQAAPSGVTAAFRPIGHGALDIRYAEYTAGWPVAAKPLPPMPAKLMAWDMSGSTVATGALRSIW
jgi:hypothetical protein